MPVELRVQEMMKKQGFKSQSALAEAAGIHQSRIGAYVRGHIRRIDLENLSRLCEALECTPGDLLEYVEPASPATS